MSAFALLNLLNELRKRDKMRGLHFISPSRKRLRAKNTPDLHLTYSNTRGSVG